jgi:hypothetical protein
LHTLLDPLRGIVKHNFVILLRPSVLIREAGLRTRGNELRDQMNVRHALTVRN